MLARIAAYYARRIVNVNVNVVAAGLLSLVPVLACVRLTEWALSKGYVDGDKLHVSDKVLIGAVTLVADLTFDVLIYYALHWLANHAGWLKDHRLKQIEAVADAAVESSPFFKDATRVQLQRAVLSPLLYVMLLGTQQLLMQVHHVQATWATVIAFAVGIGSARVVHTLWMLREERSQRAAIAAGKVAELPKAAAPEPHPIWEKKGDDATAGKR